MTAPVITIYRNGDTYNSGKRLVLNRKEIRSFDAFLDRVTKDTRSQVAVRSIRTPSHGHRVHELDKLENGGIYVAVGPEKFKKLEYKEISSLPTHRQKPPEQLIKPVVHSRVLVSGRARKVAAAESSSNKTVFVFRNGDDKQPSFKIHLDKRILHTGMDTLLQFITEKVRLRTGAVRSLYTLDGIEILEPSQLKSLEKYVAVGFGKKFLKMAYNENGTLSLTPRKGGAKVKSMSSEPPHRKKRVRPPLKALSQGHVKTPHKNEKAVTEKDDSSNAVSGKEPSDVNSIGSEKLERNDTSLERSLTQDLPTTEPTPVSNGDNDFEKQNDNERATRKPSTVENKSSDEGQDEQEEFREYARKQRRVPKKPKSKEAKRQKAASPRKESANEKVDEPKEKEKELDADDKEEEPTVFKATGDQGEQAKMVKDNEETNVDKPLDMLPAEEVEEELDANNVQKDDPENNEDSGKQANEDKEDGVEPKRVTPNQDDEPSNAVKDGVEEGSKPE